MLVQAVLKAKTMTPHQEKAHHLKEAKNHPNINNK